MTGGFVVVWQSTTPPFIGYGHLPTVLPYEDALSFAMGLQAVTPLADCRAIPEGQFQAWKEQVS